MFFSGIDFRSGEVHYLFESLEEDMLLVCYPNEYALAVGWHEEEAAFAAYIVRDGEWSVPVVQYMTRDPAKLRQMVLQAVARVETESQKAKAYYGGLWKTETMIV